jgi:hypothetical protein
MRAREWSYILVDLPLIVPPTMLVGTDARRVWIIAHFTQVAVEVEGAVLDTADVGTDAEDEDHDHGAYLFVGPLLPCSAFDARSPSACIRRSPRVSLCGSLAWQSMRASA